jgi:hypothetical protein
MDLEGPEENRSEKIQTGFQMYVELQQNGH